MAKKPVKTIHEQGPFILARDVDDKLVARVMKSDKVSSKNSWRAALRALTNNGNDLYATLINISRGVPHVPILPDGSEGEPITPSIESMRQAAKDLIEFLNGKAVPQTEVVKAEEQGAELDKMRAMSDMELLKIVEGEMVRVRTLSKGEATSDEPASDADAKSKPR